MKIALLASGQLGFTIFKKLLSSKYNIEAVFTDLKSDSIIALARANNISLFVGNPRNGKALEFTKNKTIDNLLSVNYIFIIEKDLINWPDKYAINVHGSLLPKYRGRTPHVWAIINNETYTGITAHLIDEECDTGDILFQKKVPIYNNDSGADILNKFNKLYPKIILDLLEKVEKNSISPVKQDNSKASFFGKRTPECGQINWNWQKERICNWVRAQAYPYPGAFTFYNKNKIIIDKIEIDDFGYKYNMKNGLILTTNPLRIKTPNGVLRISKIRQSKLEFIPRSSFKYVSNENK